MSNKTLYVLLAVLMITAVIWRVFVLSGEDEIAQPDIVSQSTQTAESTENNVDELPAEEENTEPEKKKSNQSVSSDQEVEIKPLLATGFGNSPDKPLPQGQETSTTCTTDPGVECQIIFNSGSETITFDVKTTDAQGVALWNWTGGEDVPSGTWEVVANAGNKSSLTGVVYVE